MCVSTKSNYKSCNIINGNWIIRAKESGDDLLEYRQKMGKAVSAAIMSNPIERARRSELAKETITAWAKSDIGRKVASETAKITSARPEILEARMKKLEEWRNKDPDLFFEKCISKLIQKRTTKPEKAVVKWLKLEFPTFDFKGNQRLRSKEYFHFTKTQIRQIDVMSKSHNIIVEFDGHIHFHNIEKWNQLPLVQAKDIELNVGATALGFTVIRIATSQFCYKTNDLIEKCKDKVRHILTTDRQQIVYFIGDEYDKH